MSADIKYAYKRHNTWVYRRTYPQHLQHLLGSSLKQSLKTADAKTAKSRVAELNQTYKSIIKEAEQHVSANTDQTTADIPNTCGAPADPGPRIERPRYQPLLSRRSGSSRPMGRPRGTGKGIGLMNSGSPASTTKAPAKA